MTAARKRDPAVDHLLDVLAEIPALRDQRMFGGHGFWAGERFFAIVYAGRVFFRTDDASRSRYEEHGSGPLRASEKVTLRRYYEVPVEVLEQPRRLLEWAREAIATAE